MKIKVCKVDIFKWKKTWSLPITVDDYGIYDILSVADILSMGLDSILTINLSKKAILYSTPLTFSYKKVKGLLLEVIEDTVPVLPEEVRTSADCRVVSEILWGIKSEIIK